MALLGFVIILGVFITYLTMLFVLHRFTYKTWVFDIVVGAGMLIGIVSWFQESSSWLSWSTIALGVIWFIFTRIELKIVGSKELHLRVGDSVPTMTFLKTDSTPFTEQDLIANAPALLTLYRGWWCPSSKTQLDEIMANYESFHNQGVAIYAASVDEPEMAIPIQEHVGNKITILCGVSEEVLTTAGVLDKKGAPWYDRIILGAPERPIATPATLVIDKSGRIIFVSRSVRIDDNPRVNEILAGLARLPSSIG
jgi:peroxiredoxin